MQPGSAAGRGRDRQRGAEGAKVATSSSASSRDPGLRPSRPPGAPTPASAPSLARVCPHPRGAKRDQARRGQAPRGPPATRDPMPAWPGTRPRNARKPRRVCVRARHRWPPPTPPSECLRQSEEGRFERLSRRGHALRGRVPLHDRNLRGAVRLRRPRSHEVQQCVGELSVLDRGTRRAVHLAPGGRWIPGLGDLHVARRVARRRRSARSSAAAGGAPGSRDERSPAPPESHL